MIYSNTAFNTIGVEAEEIFCMYWTLQSKVSWKLDRMFQTSEFVLLGAKKTQLDGIFVLSSFLWRCSSFNGFSQKIFAATAIEEETSGPYAGVSLYSKMLL